MDRLHTYEPKCKDSLGGFEVLREEEHRKAMRHEIQNEIMRRDRVLFQGASRKCSCGGDMHAHGFTNTMRYQAVCGDVRVRLKRLRCVSCGHIRVPGNVLIPKSKISAPLSEMMCDLASKMSYERAVESIYIQHGIKISTKRFWASIQEESKLITDIVAIEADDLYENAVVPPEVDLKGQKPLIIGIDGGWVSGWKENPSFEVKCATIATGSTRGPGKQRHLNDRVGYAAQCNIEEFSKRVSVLAIKSGYLTASSCIFVSDGALWISKLVSGYFPDAIHVLDMFHLKKKIELLFGIKAEVNTAAGRDAALSACDTFEPESIYAVIKSYESSDIAKTVQKDDLLTYIKNNSLTIRNHKHVNIHGSGWIEKGVDLMVSRRMKNRGMAWTERGSSNIIPFAVLRYNKQWDVYWNTRKGLSCEVAS
jgi:hypothetical protein